MLCVPWWNAVIVIPGACSLVYKLWVWLNPAFFDICEKYIIHRIEWLVLAWPCSARILTLCAIPQNWGITASFRNAIDILLLFSLTSTLVRVTNSADGQNVFFIFLKVVNCPSWDSRQEWMTSIWRHVYLFRVSIWKGWCLRDCIHHLWYQNVHKLMSSRSDSTMRDDNY